MLPYCTYKYLLFKLFYLFFTGIKAVLRMFIINELLMQPCIFMFLFCFSFLYTTVHIQSGTFHLQVPKHVHYEAQERLECATRMIIRLTGLNSNNLINVKILLTST